MAIQTINLGNYANDGTGDDLRTAFEKVVVNFETIDLTRVISADNLVETYPTGGGGRIFKEKVANNLKLRSVKAGLNVTVTETATELVIATPDSINSLAEDPNPLLAGNLNLNGYSIVGTGNVDIDGLVIANALVGTLNGNVYVENSQLFLTALNTTTSLYEPISLNAIVINGNSSVDPGTSYISTLPGDSLGIVSDVDLEIVAVNGEIRVSGDIVSTDTIYAETFVGDVIGNVNGIVSDISNHDLRDLNDVLDATPNQGQALVWNGTYWVPDNIEAPPLTLDYEFGRFGVSASNPFDLLLQATSIDFGTMTAPAGFILDLGPIITGTAPFYALSKSSSSIVEGSSFTITLNTQNVEDGTFVPYTITGVTSEDIEGASLTGFFTVIGNTAQLIVNTTLDIFDEGSETFTITLDDAPSISTSVIIQDILTTLDGGSPTTTPTSTIDGGSPSTSVFDAIYDGGGPTIE